MNKLLITDDTGKSREISLALEEITIGRSPDNTLCLKERNVSRHHARLFKDKNHTFIAEDLNSYNGLWVNGERILGRKALKEGDLLQVGDFKLYLGGMRPEIASPENDDPTKISAYNEDLELPKAPYNALSELEVTEPNIANDKALTTSPLTARENLFKEAAPAPIPLPEALPESTTQTMPLTTPATPPSTLESAVTTSEDPEELLADIDQYLNAPPPEPPKEVPYFSPPKPPVNNHSERLGERDFKRHPTHEATAIVRLDQLGKLAPELTDEEFIVGPRAKLICLSNNLDTLEFTIDKTNVLLGRTPDNDIVLNHRSISRHHAKIIYSNKRYKIIDLGSANGTFINDEEYVETELKNNDLIELGHVQLKFVPPAELNLPSISEDPPSAPALTTQIIRQDDVYQNTLAPPPPTTSLKHSAPPKYPELLGDLKQLLKTNPALVLSLVGLSLALLITTSILFLGNSHRYDLEYFSNLFSFSKLAEIEDVSTKDHDHLAHLKKQSKQQLEEAEEKEQNPELTKLLKQIQASLNEQNWEQALTLIDTILKIEPNLEAAKTYLKQAERENNARKFYETALAASNHEDWEVFAKALSHIPEQSWYYPKALSLKKSSAKIKTEKDLSGTKDEKPTDERHLQP